jgi:hypothetical protein
LAYKKLKLNSQQVCERGGSEKAYRSSTSRQSLNRANRASPRWKRATHRFLGPFDPLAHRSGHNGARAIADQIITALLIRKKDRD